MTSNDYKWYEYCQKCKIPKYIGELPNGPWKRCGDCGEFLNYCSKDVLDELTWKDPWWWRRRKRYI